MNLSKSDIEKFWSRVDKSGECWLWLGYRMPNGYGNLSLGKHKNAAAHRIAYVLEYGQIPDGKCVCHRCDVRACVRASHLFIGTIAENTADRHAKDRDAHRQGEAQHLAKLRNVDIPVIRGLEASGKSIMEIARQYGVTYATIWQVIHGRTWRHIP